MRKKVALAAMAILMFAAFSLAACGGNSFHPNQIIQQGWDNIVTLDFNGGSAVSSSYAKLYLKDGGKIPYDKLVEKELIPVLSGYVIAGWARGEKDDDGNVTGTKTVRVADMNTVSGILKDYGLINYKWLFQLYSRFSNAEVQLSPGTYALTTNLDYRALVKKMQTGADSQLQTLVMFPEGYNLDQVFARLEENGVCSREDLYAAAANAEFSYAFLEGVETGDPYRLEAFLFPDTYYFYQGMQASSAINKFLSNLHYRITDEMWQKAQAMNLTFKQVITVASLIEREAANDAERATIASVIYNRLNIGMPLQLDSTVVYAIRETGETTMSTELIQATDSPYNTYLYQGLPPGPICNPGMKSIEAALNPEQTGYYYFALDMETKSMLLHHARRARGVCCHAGLRLNASNKPCLTPAGVISGKAF